MNSFNKKYFSLCLVFLNPMFLLAHTDLDSHPGLMSNLIAIGIVLISMVAYLFISNYKRRRKKEK